MKRYHLHMATPGDRDAALSASIWALSPEDALAWAAGAFPGWTLLEIESDAPLSYWQQRALGMFTVPC